MKHSAYSKSAALNQISNLIFWQRAALKLAAKHFETALNIHFKIDMFILNDNRNTDSVVDLF